MAIGSLTLALQEHLNKQETENMTQKRFTCLARCSEPAVNFQCHDSEHSLKIYGDRDSCIAAADALNKIEALKAYVQETQAFYERRESSTSGDIWSEIWYPRLQKFLETGEIE